LTDKRREVWGGRKEVSRTLPISGGEEIRVKLACLRVKPKEGRESDIHIAKEGRKGPSVSEGTLCRESRKNGVVTGLSIVGSV